ncbi:MAG: glycosyltransferase family 39 protein [Pseudomonadota bacterium]
MDHNNAQQRPASRLWSLLRNHPWLTMILAVAAQTWFTLSNRALWFSDEVRYANAYQNLVNHGKWLVLSLNGQPYPDKPPVYFWFLWLIDTLTPADMPAVFFLGAALSGLFFVVSTHVLARTLGFDRSVCLASVLMLLSNFFLLGLFHYSRMDLLFAGLIILSHACLFRAVSGPRQRAWPLAAFALAGLATLTKGPIGFILPLMTLALYLLWRGEVRRLFTRAMALGLMGMLAMLVAWVGGVMLVEGPSFLMDTVLGKHVLQRATHTFHHREPFTYYFIALPLAWLPWTLFAVAAPARRLFSLEAWGESWGGRREAGPTVFLWIMVLATFVFLSSLSGKVLIYILPMFPPLALLTAQAMTRLDAARSARFWSWVAGLWLALGAGLLVVGDLLPFPVPVRGLGLSACLLLAGGLGLFWLRRRGSKTCLLWSVLAVTLWLYPVGLMVAPSLDDAMSPKRQAEMIGEHVRQGYAPLSYKVYSGIFTYYAGSDIEETGDFDELVGLVERRGRVILVIRDRHWDEWADRPARLRVIDRQNVAGMTYLLVVGD